MRLELWDTSAKVTLDKRMLAELTSLRFLETHRHAVVLGPVSVPPLPKRCACTRAPELVGAADPHRVAASSCKAGGGMRVQTGMRPTERAPLHLPPQPAFLRHLGVNSVGALSSGALLEALTVAREDRQWFEHPEAKHVADGSAEDDVGHGKLLP